MIKATRTGATLACLVWVSGCASPANQAQLETYRLNCAARDWNACAAIPAQEKINNDEANKNLAIALLLPVLLPIAFLMAAAEDGGGGIGSTGAVYHHHGYHGYHAFPGGGHHGGHR